ncbi:MAG TPA: zinc-binding dehydrogenase, partial [Friedmanniella sp.]
PMVVSYTRTPAELRARTTDLFTWAGDHRLTVNIGGRYPLTQAGDAITALTSRATTGKILLTH